MPWIIASIATAGLYFGRSVLIPITLAILLSFLLAPIVAAFRRLRLGRGVSVVLALLISLTAMAVTSGVIVSQASTLTKDAPAYAETISDKVARLRAGVQQRFGFLLKDDQGGSRRPATERARRKGERALSAPRTGAAIPVEVAEAPQTAMDEVKTIVLPALAPIETTFIVLIVTVFILLQKEDLRDRVIRLMGVADLHRTTLALDDGAKRLSRYFLSQFIVNCGFGAAIWLGLYLIGIPSPGLWGILAGLLRFVPYVGVLIAAVGPLALAVAIDPGWMMVASVGLLFVLLEPLVGYAIEPFLYGRSTGLSPFSVVVAALFWTWIWGAIGLVLAMPLTLLLVALGRHIPAFAAFDILLGDRPALTPVETFYQRILAGHTDEAIDQAEDLLETISLADYYDNVVLAALRMAAADVDRGAVERAAMQRVGETALEVLNAVDAADTSSDAGPVAAAGLLAICIPGRGPLDGAVAFMAAALLRRAGFTVDLRSRTADALATEAASNRRTVPIVCFTGLFDARAFRRIRPFATGVETHFPGARVLFGVCRILDEREALIEGELHNSLVNLCADAGSEAPTARSMAVNS